MRATSGPTGTLAGSAIVLRNRLRPVNVTPFRLDDVKVLLLLQADDGGAEGGELVILEGRGASPATASS